VKLNVWRGSSEDILQRGVIEARGGRFDADAFETGATAMEIARSRAAVAAGLVSRLRRSGAAGHPAGP